MEYHQTVYYNNSNSTINVTLPVPLPQPTTTCRPSLQISHPYARLFAKKDEVKRRKIWNHALEKSIFTPYELYVPPSLPNSLANII